MNADDQLLDDKRRAIEDEVRGQFMLFFRDKKRIDFGPEGYREAVQADLGLVADPDQSWAALVRIAGRTQMVLFGLAMGRAIQDRQKP